MSASGRRLESGTHPESVAPLTRPARGPEHQPVDDPPDRSSGHVLLLRCRRLDAARTGARTGRVGDPARRARPTRRRSRRAGRRHRSSSTRATASSPSFGDPAHAVAAAVAFSRALAALRDEADQPRARVRIGIHTGEGRLTAAGADYVGIDVHYAARVSAAANGGQIVVSDTTYVAIDGTAPDGTKLVDVGPASAQGLRGPAGRSTGSSCPDAADDERALRTIDAPTNLPTPPTNFVGREDELDDPRDRPRRDAPADPDRAGRHRQDATRPASRRGGRRPVPGWHVVRRSRAGPRPGAHPGHDRDRHGHRRGTRHADHADAPGVAQAARRAARPRQPRAAPAPGRDRRRRAPPVLPATARPRHQSRATPDHGRTRIRRPAARRGQRGPAVPRPRPARPPRCRERGRGSRRRPRDRRAARRAAARHRARRGADADVRADGHPRTPRRRASISSRAVRATCRNASARCAAPSPGATTCCPATSGRSSVAARSSTTAGMPNGRRK